MGERSYHFETKDRDKGNERNIGPHTYKHSHTAQWDDGLSRSTGTSTRPGGDQGSVPQQGGELVYTLSESLATDEATPKEVKFTQSTIFDFSLWDDRVH